MSPQPFPGPTLPTGGPRPPPHPPCSLWAGPAPHFSVLLRQLNSGDRAAASPPPPAPAGRGWEQGGPVPRAPGDRLARGPLLWCLAVTPGVGSLPEGRREALEASCCEPRAGAGQDSWQYRAVPGAGRGAEAPPLPPRSAPRDFADPPGPAFPVLAAPGG